MSATIRPVLEGDSIVTRVQGGVVRRPAPADGFAVVTGEEEVFFTSRQVTEACGELARMVAERKRRR